MIKTFLFVETISCILLTDQINIMKSEISEYISSNNFLKAVCPSFYNYTKSFNSQDMILHFKNIIEKIDCEYTINEGIKECQVNNKLFFQNISGIEKNNDKILELLFSNNNEFIIYEKIEIKLFKMLSQKFLKLSQVNGNNNIKTILYKNDKDNFTKVKIFLKNLKYFLKKTTNEKLSNVESVINDIEIILKNTYYNIKYKLLNNHDFEILFAQYVNDYSMYVIPDEYFSDEYKVNFKIQKNETNINHILKKFKDALNDYQITNWFDYNIDTFKNLPKIYELINIIFKKESFELTLNDFYDIYFYYNYVLTQSYIKIFVAKKLLLFRDDANNFEFQTFFKYSEVCTKIKSQNNLLGKMIQELNKSSINNIKTIRCACQTIAYPKFIEIDQIYYDIVHCTLSTDDIEKDRLYDIKKILINTLKSIKYDQNIYELYKKSFFNFKLKCILLLRLCSIYLYMRKKFVLEYDNLIDCIDNNIQEITKVLYTCTTQNFENRIKTWFINEIIKKYKKYKKILDDIKKEICFIEKLDITKFIYDDLIFNLFLFNISNDSELTLKLFSEKIPYYDLSNVFIKDNILGIKHYNDSYKKIIAPNKLQYRINESPKPKKTWINNWNIENNNS
ncbi:hypothetical protein NUSPORA_02004 [Nucleospora cyclopteri]